MPAVQPYINYQGNCEEAFNFYKSIFGGAFIYVGRYKDMPPQEGMTMSEAEGGKIMHMSLSIGKGTYIMGSDVGGEWAKYAVQGNNISLSVNADSTEEADRIYSGLSAGGNANMPMAQTFWGSYFGMLTDKFGINWMVSFEKAQHDVNAHQN